MNELAEVLRRVRAEGAFESWSHKPSAAQVQEDATILRASSCLRDASAAIFEMDKVVASSTDMEKLVPQLVRALRSLSKAMDEIDFPEAAGALAEVGDFLDSGGEEDE